MAAPSGDKQTLDEEEITPFTEREMSTLSLPSIGEVYEGALDDGVIDGPIELRPGRRTSIGSTSNFSVESDDVSRMTTDSKKKRRSSRKSRSHKTSSSSRSKRKGSGSGPSYSEVDLENAYRMLEEKDIVVSSLVKQVEELQHQLSSGNNGKTVNLDGVDEEKDVADELVKAKRLLAEKEAVAESLIEQTKIRQRQLDEKTSVIEEQKQEITRLKAKLATTSGSSSSGNVIEQLPRNTSSQDNMRSSSRSLGSKSGLADKKKEKKKKSSSKRQSSSRKIRS